jgi:tetratricopeptide (TPR) repeat protein
MARQQRENGSFEKAIELADNLLSQGKHVGEAYLEKGESLFATKKYNEAINALQKAQELLKDNVRASFLLGEIYSEQNKWSKAALNYSKALEKNSTNLDILMKTTNAYRHAKNPKNALAILQKYKSNFYDTKIVTKEIGLLKFELGDTVAARGLLELCVNIKPPEGDVFLTLGDIYAAAGENIKATMMYEKAAPLTEDKNRVKISLTNLYIIKKDYGNAERNVRAVLTSNPEYEMANRYLGDILIHKKQYKAALPFYEKERELHGNNAYLTQQIALIHFKSNNYTEAEKEYKVLLKLAPTNTTAYYHLAIISLKLKKASAAESYLAQAEVSGKVDKTIYRDMAREFVQVKVYEKAIKYYGKYLSQSPKDKKVWEELADIYILQKNKSKAAQTYVKIYEVEPVNNQSYLAKAGHTYYEIKMRTEAQKTYARFLEKGYKDPTVNINSAEIEFAGKNYNSTINLLKGLTGEHANKTEVLNMLAISHYKLKKYAGAAPYIKKLLPKKPNDRKLTEIAAITYEKTNDLKSASAMYRKYLTFKPTKMHQTYAFHLAGLYEKQKATSLALDQYRKNLTTYPDDLRNYEKLIELYTKSRNYTAAVEVINRAISKKMAPLEFYRKLVEIYTLQGKKTLAASAYEKYLVKDPKNDTAWFNLGSIYFSKANYKKAIPPFTKAVNLQPRKSKYVFKLALAYSKSGNTKEAIKYYKKGLSLAPKDEAKWKELAALHTKTKNDTAAANVYVKLFELNPSKNSSYLSKAGHLYNKMGLKTEANKAYARFVDKGFKDPEVNIKAAEIEFKNKNYNKTITLLKGVTGEKANNKNVLKMMVVSHYKTRKYSASIPYLKKLMPKVSQDKKYIEIAALTYEETKDLKSASTMYRKYLTFKGAKNHKKYSYHLGTLYEKQNATSLAINQYTKNIATYPDDMRNYEKLVILYMKSRNYNAAAGIINKAILKPKAPIEFHLKLIEIYTKQNKRSMAAGAYEKYLKKAPSNDTAWYNLGSIYFSQNNFSKAVIPLEKACKLKPRKSKYQFKLAQAYSKSGNTSKAITAYNTGLRSDPNNEKMLLELAELYKKTKKESSVADVYQKLYKINPKKNSSYLSKAGHTYYKLGMIEKAQESYSKYVSKGFTDPQINVNLAKLEYRDRNYQKTITLLKDVKGKYVLDTEILKMQVSSHYHLRKYSGAIPYLKTLMPKIPKDREYTEIAAICYEKTGDLKSAAAMYKRYLTLGKTKKHQEYSFHLAQLYEKQKSVTNALNQYEKNIIAYPSDFRNYESLVEMYKSAKIYNKAVIVLKKATARPEASVRFHKELIDIYKLQKKKSLAASAYEKYLTMAQNDDSAWYDLGTIYYDQSNYKKSIRPLEEAVKLKPRKGSYCLKLASAYEKTGNKSKAIMQYKAGLKSDPNNETAWKSLAKLYAASKMDNEAADAYYKIYEISPKKNLPYLTKAGHLYNKLGKKDKAQQAYSKLISSGAGDAEVKYNSAIMEYEAKNYEKTITLLKGLPKNYTARTKAITMLAFSYNNTKKFSRALPYLKQLLLKKPKDAEVIEMAAIAYEKTGDNRSAAEMYKKFLATKKTGKHQEYAYHLGTLYEKSNQKKNAIAQYESNIKLYPSDLRSYERLAELYTASRNHAMAIKVISKAVKLPKAPASLQKILAEIYYSQGKKKLAAQSYEQYVIMESTDSSAWINLSKIYYSQKEYKKAVTPLEKSTRFLPRDGELHYKLAHAQYESGNPKGAIPPCKKAYELKPGDNKIITLLTKCYVETENTGALIAILQKRAVTEPRNYGLHFQLGNLLLADNKIPQAINAFEKACSIKPEDINTHMTLISLYEGNHLKQLEHINTALKYSPNNADLHYEKAVHLLTSKQIDRAKASLEKTVKINPQHALAHFSLGTLYKEDKNYKNAYNHFRLAAKYEENNLEYLLNLTETAYFAGKKELALKSVHKALKVEPNNAKLLEMAGSLYIQGGQEKKAETTLLKALRVDSKCKRCHEHLGKIYFNRTDYVKAITYFEKAIQRDPTNDEAMVLMGNALVFQGDKKRALTYYDNAYSANTRNDEALYKVVAMNIDMGNVKNAEAAIRKKTTTKKTAWVHLANARVLEATGNSHIAMTSYKTTLKSMPQNSDALMGMGRIYLEQKKYSKAINSFSKAMIEQPDNADIYIGMGKAYFVQRNYEAAIELFSDVIKTQMGLSYRKMGKHDKAIVSLKKSVRHNPKNADCQFVLGLEYEESLKYKEAIMSFTNAIKYDNSKAVHIYPRIGDIYYYKLKDNKKAKKFYQKYIDAGGTSNKIKKLMKTL